jgi:hypothetical protein
MSSMNRSSGGAGTWPTYSTDSVWPTSRGEAQALAGAAAWFQAASESAAARSSTLIQT